MGESNNVIDFPVIRTEEINGVAMDLDHMAIEELRLLEIQCSQRFIQTHNELEIVREYLVRRMPDGGDEA